MKKLVFALSLTLVSALGFASKITATVIFENLTNKELIFGRFTCVNLNQTITVTNTESFTINLPEKGKYQFHFDSNDFTTYTYYPTRINHKNNTITIRLTEKTNFNNSTSHTFPLDLETDLSPAQIEERLANGQLNFIDHGLEASIPETYLAFKEKYGIGLIKKNCALDPVAFKKAIENNRMIFDYLNAKYGSTWINELSEKPLGIKQNP